MIAFVDNCDLVCAVTRVISSYPLVVVLLFSLFVLILWLMNILLCRRWILCLYHAVGLCSGALDISLHGLRHSAAWLIASYSDGLCHPSKLYPSSTLCSDAVQLTAGSCRAKSAKSICLKNVMDVMFGGVAYYLLGWAFAYGDKVSCDADDVCTSIGNPFIGTEWFAMSETPATSYATFYFQYVVSLFCLQI